MTSTTTRQKQQTPLDENSWWTTSSLLSLSAIMLAIGSLWRIVDIFVLGLGDTWLNILPSKLFPLLILVLVFHRFRREELSTVLGLSQEGIISHTLVGVVVGVSMFLLIDAGAVIIYGTLFDPTYPLEFQILFVELLAYQFVFFFINAVFEESLFRGLLQNGLRSRFSVLQAILLSASVFSAWHIVWPIANGVTEGFGVSQAGVMLLYGLVFGAFQGIYYERFSARSSLAGPITAHTLVNFFNESFRIGPELAIQGPDVAFTSPVMMGIMAVLFVSTMSILFMTVWRFRIENVDEILNRHLKRIRGLKAVAKRFGIRNSEGGQ